MCYRQVSPCYLSLLLAHAYGCAWTYYDTGCHLLAESALHVLCICLLSSSSIGTRSEASVLLIKRLLLRIRSSCTWTGSASKRLSRTIRSNLLVAAIDQI